MNFNSPQFLLFFPTVVLLYCLVYRRERWRDLLLLVASYAFYMSWNWKYSGLILLSTVIDYVVGRALARAEDPHRRKRLLLTSLTTNLGLLGLFKYFNFFADVTGDGLHLLGIDADLSIFHHHLLLPVGISFYTFQTLSYTLDIYYRQIRDEPSFVKFALFVSFFPQLVAGPIVRAADFLPQLRTAPSFTRARVQSGMALMFRGLFKKVVLADLLAGLGVDAVFAHPSLYSSWTLLLALYGYSFQIYNDFSGYSDIAIGAARILGFELPINFDRPYLSQNPREFWTRWHISLSTWLRDYLYIPLGGNRGSPMRVKFNLLMTMFLGGLWHGAALNFVFWGIWHGLLLTVIRGPRRNRGGPPDGLPGRLLRRFGCFHLIAFSWLLFRIGSAQDLWLYLKGLLTFTGGSAFHPLYYAILGTAVVAHFVSRDWVDSVMERWAALPAPVQAVGYAALILFFSGVSFGAPAFIYFQF